MNNYCFRNVYCNIFYCILFFLLIVSCKKISPADKVINDYIKAIGGKSLIESIETIFVIRELEHLEDGKKSMNYSYQKRPNMRHYGELDASEFLATNGDFAWQVNTDSTGYKLWDELNEDEAASLIQNGIFYRFIGPFIDAKDNEFSIKFIGSTKIDSISLNHIQMMWPDEQIWDYFFDAKTKLIYMFKPDENFIIKMLEWKEFDGLIVATLTYGSSSAIDGPQHYNRIVDFKLNKNLHDSLFIAPIK